MIFHFLVPTIIIGLLLIVIQDFKFRAVYWWLFPLIFISGSLFSLLHQQWPLILLNTTLNFLYVVFVAVLVLLYFKVREGGSSMKIVGSKIGWGDVLFFVAVTPLFEFLSYIFFITLSCVFSLIVHFSLKRTRLYGSTRYIPLAGLQSLFLLGHLLFNHFSASVYHFTLGYVG